MSSMPEVTMYDEVLIAITHEPRRYSEIRAIVEQTVGRPVPRSTIKRAITRAIERGAAVKTNEGYREPLDSLSDWGAGFDEAVGRGTESGIGVGPGASTPDPVGRGVKRESDAPQTEGIVDRNDTTQ